MADILTPKEFPTVMVDPHGKQATVLRAVDLTEDIPNADYTFVVYYGLDDDTVIVVQLIEERGHQPRKSVIFPLAAYSGPLPESISKFLAASFWLKPDLVARLVQENAK